MRISNESVGSIAFERTCVGVDDPVLRNSLLPVHSPLATAVGVLGRGREHFDGEKKPTDFGPRAHRRIVHEWHDEEVGLNELARAVHDHVRGGDHCFADAMGPHVRSDE